MTSEREATPESPTPAERLPPDQLRADQFHSPHPATLTADQLLRQCDLRTQRRSGPGGQHRNKTSSGVFLRHQPTGVVAEATERRSQADNRGVALSRLRMRLAVEVRTASISDGPCAGSEAELRAKYVGSDLRINQRNADKAAVLALVLNDLHAAGGQPSVVAKSWQTTTSAVVRLVKTHAPAFALLNVIRQQHRRSPLK